MLLRAIPYFIHLTFPPRHARRAIEATLDYTGGDKTRTARTLRIGRKTLYRKLLNYQNDVPSQTD